MTIAFVWLLALAQGAGSPPQPPVPPATPAPADQPPPTTAADPARLVFATGTSGLVLVAVKADRTADYEAAIAAVKAAVAAAPAADRAFADGWQVFKAKEPDAKGNALYVHWVPAPQVDVDYRPSLVLERLAAAVPEALLVKYRDALAAPPSRLSLDALATLGVAPVPPPKR